MVGERWETGMLGGCHFGPWPGRSQTTLKSKAPELGLAASGSLLVVLSSDASVLLIIVLREVWVRCVQRILRVFGHLLLLSYALYNAAHCRYLTTAKSRRTRPMKNARRRGAAAAV